MRGRLTGKIANSTFHPCCLYDESKAPLSVKSIHDKSFGVDSMINPYLCDNTTINKIEMRNSKSLTYKILLHKEPEGEYTVTVPALPGCITYGENIDHAIEMAKEAIELYISELKEKGKEIPDDSNTFEYSINLIDA
jgi:predicted RNase H-like HicB family nuclease